MLNSQNLSSEDRTGTMIIGEEMESNKNRIIPIRIDLTWTNKKKNIATIDLKKENIRIKTQSTKIEKENVKLKEEANENVNKMNNLEEELKSKREEMNIMSSKAREAKQSKESEEKTEKMKGDIKFLLQELKELHERNILLQNRRKTMNESYRLNEDLQKEFEDLKEELERKGNEKNELVNENERLEKQIEEINSKLEGDIGVDMTSVKEIIIQKYAMKSKGLYAELAELAWKLGYKGQNIHMQ